MSEGMKELLEGMKELERWLSERGYEITAERVRALIEKAEREAKRWS